jgi:polysaccharide biosynthesis protein PelD
VDELSKDQEPYLLAAPIAVNKGPVLGVLIVEAIPFFAFHEENLRNLFSILCYYADSVFSAGVANGILSRFPQCPIPFASEYLRLHRIYSETGLQSVLACRVISQEFQSQNPLLGMDATLPASIGVRSIDRIWIHSLPNKQIALFVLMPFVSTAQAKLALGRFQVPVGHDWTWPMSAKDAITTFSDALAEINLSSASMPIET